MQDRDSEYRITLYNPEINTRLVRYVQATCFADAASKAYLSRNNKNNGKRGAWWKIDSVAAVRLDRQPPSKEEI